MISTNSRRLNFFNSFVDKGLIERLKFVAESPFIRMSYTDAVKELEKNNDNFSVDELNITRDEYVIVTKDDNFAEDDLEEKPTNTRFGETNDIQGGTVLHAFCIVLKAVSAVFPS